MDIILLPAFTEAFNPIGAVFNSFGVVTYGYKYSFILPRLKVTFCVCSLNGLWGGALDIFTNTWGCGEPVTKESFIFTSFEECVTSLWSRAIHSIEVNKSNVIKEYAKFMEAKNKWFAMSPYGKLNCFKVGKFYEY